MRQSSDTAEYDDAHGPMSSHIAKKTLSLAYAVNRSNSLISLQDKAGFHTPSPHFCHCVRFRLRPKMALTAIVAWMAVAS